MILPALNPHRRRAPGAAIAPLRMKSRRSNRSMCGPAVAHIYLCLLAASAVCGCGSRSDLAAVHGKVTLDSQPLPDAFVVFAPTAHGTTSYGRTDAGGN